MTEVMTLANRPILVLGATGQQGPQIAQVFREALAMPAHYEQQPVDEIRGFREDLALMYEWLNDYRPLGSRVRLLD